jgi:amino acid transporter/nucleotide-binding universal stress UspA family protein
METTGIRRPRNVDWKRAAALLYGDWGTSKAYVIGLAFVAAGFASLPIIIAVCTLTAVVGYNYVIICKHFPDGGGVYSAARSQSRLLAVVGALLLVANFTVTAALSGWAAMNYFGVPRSWVPVATIACIVLIGVMNYFGPKHTGSVAVSMAVPTVVVVVIIILASVPHLTTEHLHPLTMPFNERWMAFVGVILALSGVEAIANLTGVMRLDPGADPARPSVAVTARWAILPVAAEVVLGTCLLGWAMLSLPEEYGPQLRERAEDMVRFLGEHYVGLLLSPQVGQVFGVVVGVLVGVLLLSAVNTAIVALIGLSYMMARDGEMPRSFARLNPFGVPWLPMLLAVLMPAITTAFSPDLGSLAELYAIGVVGAITVNLGACSLNRNLPLKWHERGTILLTFAVLAGVELTIAYTKHSALFFVLCILLGGLGLRSYAQRMAGLRTITVRKEVAAAVEQDTLDRIQLSSGSGQFILVAARGLTPVLKFALEEAKLRQGTLYVLFVKEIAVSLLGPLAPQDPPRWQSDAVAARIMYAMLKLAQEHGVRVIPVYAVSEDPAATILDLAATLGIDILMLGATQRRSLVRLLKGNVVGQVARNLPENIQLLIHG